MAAVRQSVLAQMRLMNESSPAVCGSTRQQMDSIVVDSNTSIGSAISASKQMVRFFAGDSSYLDKEQVTDRVLNVVKNFDKVEQSKVRIGSIVELKFEEYNRNPWLDGEGTIAVFAFERETGLRATAAKRLARPAMVTWHGCGDTITCDET